MSYKSFFLRNFGWSVAIMLGASLAFSLTTQELKWVPFGVGLLLSATTAIAARIHWNKRIKGRF